MADFIDSNANSLIELGKYATLARNHEPGIQDKYPQAAQI